MRVETIDHDWRALVPAGRIEIPGEVLHGGLVPDGPIPPELLARLEAAVAGRPAGLDRRRPRPRGARPLAGAARAPPRGALSAG